MAMTVDELAEEAGLSLQCLEKAFCVEHVHALSEFCDPWENIGYHLKLTKSNINSIWEDNATTEGKGIVMLENWKEKLAHKATYRVLIEALIQSEHAQQALNLCQRLKDNQMLRAIDHSEMPLSPSKEPTVSDVDVIGSIGSIDQFQKQYICIQNRFLQSGDGKGVTLEQLQTCISTLPSFTSNTPQLLLEVSSIKLFMFNMKEYCCALNPDIFERLIEVLGDAEIKSIMREYNKDLHDFQCKTKSKYFVGNNKGPHSLNTRTYS